MTTVTCSSTVPSDLVDGFLAPRDDLVLEQADGDGHFSLITGPFREWQRVVELSDTAMPDEVAVIETITFKIAAPFWGGLFARPVKGRLVKAHRRIAAGNPPVPGERAPFWLPPDRLSPRAAMVLSSLVTLSLVVGYLGTIITQTITFAAAEFGATTGDQGTVLAAVRVGVLLSLAIVMLADRRGRRVLLLASVVLSCLTAAVGAVATDMVTLGVYQTVSRAFATSAVILLAVVAAEEMPASSRAYAIGVMTLTGGLGAGMCVWFLPLADTGPGGWRWLYVLPLFALPLIFWTARYLPETERFVRPHVRAKLTGHGGRLLLLGTALFAAALFAAPASQLQNDFLKNEQGFSAARITLFTLLTSTPGGIGIAVGGYLADERGRRLIGTIGILGGSVCTVLAFLSSGWTLWMWSLIGTVLAGMAVPALAVYGPELFPTALRGKANGILQTAAVAGSSCGLLGVGALVDHWGRLGSAMAVVMIGPVLVALLLVVAYPETAHMELEDLNPEDRSRSNPSEHVVGPPA